jgi:hypothetical protein
VVLAAVLAGCMGGDSASIEADELESLVLQQADMPGFVRFDEGRQGIADQPPGARNDPTRFGREDGWKARYRKPGGADTPGPLVVESRVDAFGDSDGAADELAAHREALAEGLRLTDGRPELGDGSFVATGTQGRGRFAVRFYLVGWRDENATASVFANGFEGKLALEQVVELARKQQARIEDAA